MIDGGHGDGDDDDENDDGDDDDDDGDDDDGVDDNDDDNNDEDDAVIAVKKYLSWEVKQGPPTWYKFCLFQQSILVLHWYCEKGNCFSYKGKRFGPENRIGDNTFT